MSVFVPVENGPTVATISTNATVFTKATVTTSSTSATSAGGISAQRAAR
jgi:hypothetical protein